MYKDKIFHLRTSQSSYLLLYILPRLHVLLQNGEPLCCAQCGRCIKSLAKVYVKYFIYNVTAGKHFHERRSRELKNKRNETRVNRTFFFLIFNIYKL